MRRAARGLLRAVAFLLVALAVGPVGNAIAVAPKVTITSPLNGSATNNRTLSFSGLAQEGGGEVTLSIYAGPTVGVTPIQEPKSALLTSGTWSLEPDEPLKDATYTVRATQTNGSETAGSSPVTFTVNTVAPTVTVNSPASPSDNTTPSFIGTASDTTPVTIQIHAGAMAKGTLVSAATAAGTGAGWTSGKATPALSTGQYTAIATQASSIPGNPTGRSAPVTFTVTPPPVVPPPAPPTASFKWFPAVPATGEPVSLVSSSTDAGSPITGIAWALTSNGPFQAGGAVLITSFSTPGGHVVRLRVANAAGLSSVVAQTINVVGRRAPLMQPFPVVRIAGIVTASGLKLSLLKVQQMPVGARITVRCRGPRCPRKSAKRVARSNRRGVAPVEFRGFERFLRSGIVLEVRVSKPGWIGKYTRLTIRRGKLPERDDKCLDPAGVRTLVCPSS